MENKKAPKREQELKLFRRTILVNRAGNIIILTIVIVILFISEFQNYRTMGIFTAINFCIAMMLKSYCVESFIKLYEQNHQS